MDFKDINSIKQSGFTGFKTVEELSNNKNLIPKEKGVYLILNLENNCKFLQTGTGGFFKGKNPNVSIEMLEKKWIEKNPVVYIGKATELRKRLGQYLSFGKGKNVGHWGGRFIWQLNNSNKLVVCWKILLDENPKIIESNLINNFVTKYGRLPFANLMK